MNDSAKFEFSFFRLFCGLIFVFCAQAIVAEVPTTNKDSATNRGLLIAQEAERRDSGFGDSSVNLTMHLNLSAEEQIRREMRQLTLEIEGDGDKSIMVFDRPPDLRGTAILTFSHKTEPDDQWLYLPALKRVKRISSADKSGPFMGSEFAYEDLGSQEVEKYSYRYLRDESIDGEPCFVIERIPKDKRSGYTRQIVWIDKSEYRLRRVDYYDRKNDLLKTLRLTDFQQFLDQYWRPTEMTMVNHQTGKSTRLVFSNYQFRLGFKDRDFSPAALSRLR